MPVPHPVVNRSISLFIYLHPFCCHRLLPPLRNRSGLEEVVRFNGVFKGFTFRVRRQKFQLPILRYLLALPHIKHIEPDQLFYPEVATGACAMQWGWAALRYSSTCSRLSSSRGWCSGSVRK